MKSYTDIEQSKKLAEILPVESADMCYRIVAHNPNDTHEYQPYCFVGTLESDIPCWSLAALLEMLPTTDRGNRNPVVCKDIRLNKWLIVYYSTAVEPTTDSGVCDNLIDACVEMILDLHEQKLI